MRISHTMLERARQNVQSYLTSASYSGPRKTTRFQIVKWAVRHYHRDGLADGLRYLERSFIKQGFSEQSIDIYSEYLRKYHDSWASRGTNMVRIGDRIELSLLQGVELIGEVGRVDLAVSRYEIWLFEEQERGTKDELRLPLLQSYYAKKFSAPISEVVIGFYSFTSIQYRAWSYTESEVKNAMREATAIARAILQARV